MRKLRMYAIALTVLCLSCNKNEEFKENEIQLSRAAIKMLLKEPDIHAQRNMYNLLSINEKATVWQEKFDSVIAGNLNQQQYEFVSKVRAMIRPELFDKSSSAFHLFDQQEKMLHEEAVRIFGKTGAFNLLASVNKNQYPPGAGDCDCSTKSDWCPSSSIAGCVRLDCKTTTGCGTLWSYTCNGDCW